MVFSSVIFLFLFLPAALLCYFLIPKRFIGAGNFALLIFSLAFYAFGEPRAVWLMLALIAVNYVFGLILGRFMRRGAKPKWLLALSVAANLSALIYFKYFMFLITNVNAVFGSKFDAGNIILPIGLSFFTFQAMSYVFDVWLEKAEVCKNPLDLALYITMFPQLVAGPIVRYDTIAAELRKRSANAERIAGGVTRFVFGLGKKILLANSLGQVADGVFGGEVTFALAWVGAAAYAFQIYYDFSGYSDMAIGLGNILGFTFPENFNFPYAAKSITDFWRRWHMSLSSWFRDYVYIPLGGSRRGKVRNIVNIVIVWALTGLWHGAAWNFVIWGLYFAVLLTAEKLFVLKLLKKAGGFVSHVYALLFITIGWVIFRCDVTGDIPGYLRAMFSPDFGFDKTAVYYLAEFKWEWVAAALLSLPLVKLNKDKAVLRPLKLAAALLVFALSVVSLVHSNFNPFIYFRF